MSEFQSLNVERSHALNEATLSKIVFLYFARIESIAKYLLTNR